MTTPFLPYCRPNITDGDVAAVTEVLRSGWLTSGPKVATFEQDFAHYAGAAHAVALASATAGMHLVLHALGVGPGDEVLTPSMTFVSTANQIVLAGAKPVFADVDPDTLMVTRATLEEAVTPRTRAVIPVHFAGAGLKLEEIRAFADARALLYVEDAAHAMGTRCGGVSVGRSRTTIFSFHPAKNLTTGEGGMVCTDDGALAERLRRLRSHGLGQNAFERLQQGRSVQAEVLEPGYKYNLTDLGAALGSSQLKRLDENNARRRALAGCYLKRLEELEEIRPLAAGGDPLGHSWHLMVVRLLTEKARLGRDELLAELKTRRIGTGVHFRAVHEHDWYRKNGLGQPAQLPNTEYNSARVLSLPLFPDMTAADVDRVVDTLKDVLVRRPR
jgi:UDP-4-amino-4-deoxy-L-arabinose-oxoglutarate aminotransferase